jgi:uncharacterized membrane protein YfhO
MNTPENKTNERLKWGTVLVLLQLLVILVLLQDFIFGDKYFAFTDVGSDTFQQFVPAQMHMATPASWASAWSFKVGLGGVAPPSLGPFSLLGIAGGADHVLALRVWVYIAKVLAGGAAFYFFLRETGNRRASALIAALAYSFCGFVMVDGQWDGHGTEFVAYALLLWAFARHFHKPDAWFIPVAIAFAAYSGVFMFSVGVFILYACIAAIIASEQPAKAASPWLTEILPRCLAGLMISAPVLLPNALQLLDSPRVTGPNAAFARHFGALFSMNDDTTVLVELASLFHKNLLGTGDRHFGWMNYLESPSFYVGMMPLLLIPQLWRGTRLDRRILVAGCLTLVLFIYFAAFRHLAFGFGLDYFRVNSLWISILLLTLFARSLGVVEKAGVGRLLLLGTAGGLALILYDVHTGLFPRPNSLHELKIAAFASCGFLLAGLLAFNRITWKHFSTLALVVVAVEAIVMNYPSFNGNRLAVSRSMPGYNDGTPAALEFLRNRDKGFYRVEKTYNSASFCDALAQGYMGSKSYWFQSAGAVAFFTDLGLLTASRIKNFTNWLPGFGERFALYSLAGIKYLVSRQPVDWPGFRQIHTLGDLLVFENDLALPLAVVYEMQLPRETFMQLPPQSKDLVLLKAAVVDGLRGDSRRVLSNATGTQGTSVEYGAQYSSAARALQRRGMVVEKFTDGHISGAVESDVPGLLVFSIPFAKGWRVTVDGVSQPLFSANLGLLATELAPGRHRIELRYSLPGLVEGLLIGLAGLVAVAAYGIRAHRRQRAEALA